MPRARRREDPRERNGMSDPVSKPTIGELIRRGSAAWHISVRGSDRTNSAAGKKVRTRTISCGPCGNNHLTKNFVPLPSVRIVRGAENPGAGRGRESRDGARLAASGRAVTGPEPDAP